MPLLATLHVRKANLASRAPWYRVKFQTKLEQAAAMNYWLTRAVSGQRKTLWGVGEVANSTKPFLRRAIKAGVVVVIRLRKDASLWTAPEVLPPG